MNLKTSASLLSTLIFSSNLHADFLPPNDLHQQDSLSIINHVTEKTFHSILDKIHQYYTPIIASHDGEFEIIAKWEDSTVNAFAGQTEDGKWQIHMFGGLARRPEITEDGFTLVACHEVGHHLAGWPRTMAVWYAASEGGSDYFATLSCARRMWEGQDNAHTEALIPDYPKKLCDETFQDEGVDRKRLCYREMLASYSAAELTAINSGVVISFDKPCAEHLMLVI